MMKRTERKPDGNAQDAHKRELAAQYLERTGIPQKYNMSAEKVLDIVNDCAFAVKVLADVQARLKTSH